MNDTPDSKLLEQWVRARSEAAFSELVRRHVDFVYSVARRTIVDPHLAEDVTQATFQALAACAPQLIHSPILSPWLHVTARNLAAKMVRQEMRRRKREQEVSYMETTTASQEELWVSIAPILDDALLDLDESERSVLLLRFFERKTATQTAQILSLSEDAVQKRIQRGMKRLRQFLVRRGVTVSIATLSLLIAAHSVQAAPAPLLKLITTGISSTFPMIELSGPGAQLVSFMKAKPVFVSLLILAVFSLGTSSFLAGRAAAPKHRQARNWQQQLNDVSSRSALPGRAERRVSLANPSQNLTIEEIIDKAVAEFRYQDRDPDAIARGVVELEAISPGMARAALDSAQRFKSEPSVYRLLAGFLSSRLAQLDGPASLEFIHSHLNNDGWSLQMLGQGWGKGNGPEAWRWFQETTTSGKIPISKDAWNFVGSEILSSWITSDPAAALKAYEELPVAQANAAKFGIADAFTDPSIRSQLLTALEGFANMERKLQLSEQIAHEWASSDPEGAAAWVGKLSFPNPGATVRLVVQIAEDWWQVDPHSTAKWIMTSVPIGTANEILESLRSRKP